MIWRLAIYAAVVVAWASSVCAQGTYYQALYNDSRAKRLADHPKMVDAGFKRLGSQFTPDDGAKGGILDLCQKAGTAVLYETNTGLPADHKKNFDAYSCIDYLQVQDDADLTSTPEKVKAAIAAWRPNMRAGMKTFVTLSKGAKPELWANVADCQALQFYIYKEGTLRKAWDTLVAWRAAHKGTLWIHPFLGRNAIPYRLKDDPVWNRPEYTPLAYNEALIWLALCAGIDDGANGLLCYSAYDISPSYPPDYAYILERWDLLPGYTELWRQIRSHDRFFTGGKRETFDNGRFVGAQWSLPTGEALRVTVDTFEAKPDVDIAVIPPPITTNLSIKSNGPVEIVKP